MRHTPGPWKVLPCPVNAGRHPLHDQRWIATADAVVEFGHDPRSWGLESGSLICEMRDGLLGNAPLIAAAPDLLAALQNTLEIIRGDLREALHSESVKVDDYQAQLRNVRGISMTLEAVCSAAIAKAKGTQ